MTPAFAAMALIAAGPQTTDPGTDAVTEASRQLSTGRMVEAIATIEPALAAYDRQFAGERRRIICSYGETETIAASLLAVAKAATAERRSVVALRTRWCDALFIKGFALADQRRFAEAAPLLERAVAMAPMHAHFLNELGYIYQQQRDWQRSYDTYERASEAAEFAPDAEKTALKGRALRGMGFALIEQGQLDRAEAIFRQCLTLDPNDAKAQNELRFIAQQRNRPRA